MRHSTVRVETIVLASACALAAALPAQERTVAIRDARVVTMQGEPLTRATVLIRGGKIEAVGTDVEIPAGADVVDAAGGTLMPGLVSAYSRAGLTSQRQSSGPSSRGRRRGGFRNFRRGSSRSSAKNEAAKKVIDGLYARQDVFSDLLECGVTTIGLRPDGDGFPGQGAVIDPTGATVEELTVDGEAFVLVKPATGTKSKKLLTDSFEKAEKIVEERKKPAPKPEEKETADEKSGEKKDGDKEEAGKEGENEEKPPDEEGEEPPAEQEKKAEKQEPEKGAGAKKKEKKKDPNLEVLADLLEGKRRAFLEISSASDLVHYLDSAGETELPKRVLVAPSHDSSEGRLDEVLDKLEKYDGILLTTPDLTTPSYSRAVVNPAARLTAGGFEVGFILGDDASAVRPLFFRLIEQVRHGLDAQAALAAVTLVPAKALGVDDRVGSIEAGKDADLLLFDGDPLDPTSKLVRIWHEGRAIDEERSQ